MIAWLVANAAKPWVRYLAYGAIAVVFLGVVALRIFNAGRRAEALDAALAVLTNGLKAKKAAANVDLSPEAEKNDPNNRDPR